MSQRDPALSWLDNWCYAEADGTGILITYLQIMLMYRVTWWHLPFQLLPHTLFMGKSGEWVGHGKVWTWSMKSWASRVLAKWALSRLKIAPRKPRRKGFSQDRRSHQHISVPLKVYSYWWPAITGFKPKTIMRTVGAVLSVTALRVLYSSPDCLDTHTQLSSDPKTTIFVKTWCLVRNTGSFFGQMIIVCGWGGALLNGTSLTMASRQTLLDQQT